MRFLIISICFLIVSCGTYPKKQKFQLDNSTIKNIENPYFSDVGIDYVYKASIDVYKRHFGGLLIIKKIGEQQHRVAFTTEMGNKLFIVCGLLISFASTAREVKVKTGIEEIGRAHV